MKLFTSGKSSKYSSRDILTQLDNCAKDFTFPMLDNGYIYPIDSRLSAYRDEDNWALIIEVFGFNYRAGGHDGIHNCLHVFGNNLSFSPGTNNDNFLYVTGDSLEDSTFDDEFGDTLNPNVDSIMIRDKVVGINKSPGFYASKGIDLEEPPAILIWEFLRGLTPEYRNDLLATDQELQKRLPKNMTLFMRLDDWFHPDLAGGETPSSNETFNLIARALATGDKDIYKPTR